MKSIAIVLLFSALLFSQTPGQVQVAPGTPAIGAPSAAAIPPDTVVLEVAGKKYTRAEVDELIASLPPQYQQQAHGQPQILNQLFLMKHLAEDAEKSGLDKQSPYKDALAFGRVQVLSQAELVMLQNTAVVSDEDQQKYYKDHPEKFSQAKVRVIYVAFNPTPDKARADGKKLPTEDEARNKIEALRKQILSGADFGKLARENSDDTASAAKDGDFGTITEKSSYPAPVKAAVFKLKPGEVSEPVREPNGFYLIRVDEQSVLPFDQVGKQLVQDMKQDRFTQTMKAMQTEYTVKVDDPAYFTPKPPPAQLQQVR
jgi:peptidyl-prolyl cis-trans isomerase C